MSKKTIVTHSGKFHADDLFAVATLQLLLGVENTDVVRTRDQDVIDRADYVVDVGGVYDPDKERFDHHQMESAGTHKSGIPYAAFGLVWTKFGTKLSGGVRQAKLIETKLVEPIDARDNGYVLYELTEEKVEPYTIQSILYAFRKMPDEEVYSYDEVFKEMLGLVTKVLKREIKIADYYVQSEGAVRRVYEQSADKRLIIFNEEQDYGRDLINSVLAGYPEPIYAVLYRPDHDMWQTLAVSKDSYTMETRKPFPKDWGGNEKTSEEMQNLTGYSDVVFVHRNGFMAVSESKETAIELAKKSLKM